MAHTAIESASYPAENVEFTLTLNGDEYRPIDMVRRGHCHPKMLHTGSVINGTLTRRFMLVRVDTSNCRSFADIRDRLSKCGSVPEGQWVYAFNTAYPTPDGDGLIGIADDAWVHPRGYSDFPVIDGAGRLFFLTTVLLRMFRSWRWLVCVGS